MAKNMNYFYFSLYVSFILLLPSSILASETVQAPPAEYQTNKYNTTNNKSTGVSSFHTIFAADTLDSNIGSSVQADLNKLNEFAQRVVQGTGMVQDSIVLTGESLTKEAVVETVKKLSVNPQDVIYFHFSGHGVNTQTGSKWPALVTKGKQLVEFDWIVSALKQKKPRLLIAMADACNNYPTIRAVARALVIEPIKQNRLFTDYKGYIVGSAASPGQWAQGKVDGGFLTLSLIESMHEAEQAARGASTWKSVVENTSNKTRGLNMQQTPQFEVQVDKMEKAPVISSSQPSSPLSVNIPKKLLKLGEQMRIEVSSQESGYIFVWDIDSNGTASLLFPNEKSAPSANYITPDIPIIIPEPGRNYSVTIGEPVGENSLVIALLKKNQQYPAIAGNYPHATVEARSNALISWLQNKSGKDVQSFISVSYQTTP
jgi:hypothetical protein